MKLLGSATKSKNAPPAQSLHRVVSMTTLWSWKRAGASHKSLFGKFATGWPHDDGSGLLLAMSAGIVPRGKSQTIMSWLSHLCANTPLPGGPER